MEKVRCVAKRVSKVGETLYEGVKLTLVNAAASISVKLFVSVVKLFNVPRLRLSRLSHYFLDELTQLLLRDESVAFLVNLSAVWIVPRKNLLA